MCVLWTVAEVPLVIWRRFMMTLWLYTFPFSRGHIKGDLDQWKGREKRIKRENLENVFICSWVYLFRDYFIEDVLCARHCPRSRSYSREQNTRGMPWCKQVGWFILRDFRDSWQVPLTVLFKVPAVNDDLQPQSSWWVSPGCHAVVIMLFTPVTH